MYIDINGKTGFRMLKGTSGKTYGNAQLMTAGEITAMTTDGIAAYTKPVITPDAGKVAAKVEAQRINGIKGEAQRQIFNRMTGTDNAAEAVVKELNSLMDGILLLEAAVDISILSVGEQAGIQALKDMASDVKAIRAMSNTAESGVDGAAKFRYDIEQVHGVYTDDAAMMIDGDGNYVETPAGSPAI